MFSLFTPQPSSPETMQILKRLQAARASKDVSEPARCVALRSGALAAQSTHLLSKLVADAKIGVLNYCNMMNPYIAPTSMATTWHAPFTAFSTALVCSIIVLCIICSQALTSLPALDGARWCRCVW